MQTLPARGLLEILQQIPDPRGRKGRRHLLSAMLAAVVCATLCGFRGLSQLQQWLALHQEPMWHLLGFTRKPPKAQAFTNLLARLDLGLLETVLLAFVDQLQLGDEATVVESSRTIEVWDGKTLRGTREGDSRAQQVLVRMDQVLKRVISSEKIPANTNEQKTALDLVRRLVLTGKLIVGDAAYCQREICQEIVDKEGDYLVTVKDNQPQLRRDIEQAFVIPRSFSPYEQRLSEELLQTAATTEKSRGRWEKRTVTTTTNLIDSGYLDWPGAAQLIRLERETKIGDKTTKTVTYAITSLSREQADAQMLLQSLRGRWSIENSCFYVLDTALAEDHCRVRSGNSSHALSVIRHAVLNLCRYLRRPVGEILREHAVKINVLLSRLCILKN